MGAYNSKIFTTKYYYNCYDIGHTWTPSCSSANLGMLLDSSLFSVKVYSALHIIMFLLQRRRLNRSSIKQLLLEILRSTCMLSWNMTGFTVFVCLFSNLLGYCNIWNITIVPAFLASVTAIFFERKSRRRMLAVYMMNVVLDAIYRMMIYRQCFKPIKHGEVLLFSVSMAGFLYFYKKGVIMQDVIGNVLSKYLIGFEESGNTYRTAEKMRTTKFTQNSETCHKNLAHILKHKLQDGPRHSLCPHTHSCYYYWIAGFVRPFLIGYAIQLAITLILSWKKILKNPSILKQLLMTSNNFKSSAFWGSFGAIFKMSNCILRWLRNVDSPKHGILTGFLAGLTMILKPNPFISMYTFCKLLELLYMKGIQAGYCPSFPYGLELLYAVVSSFAFAVALYEPQNLRPNYRKFLRKLTNNKFSLVNRYLLGDLVSDSSKRFSVDSFNYDHNYTSRALKDFLKLTVH